MEHHITERQWIEYLEAKLPDGERQHLERHLRSCARCRKVRDDMHQWEGRLESSFAEYGATLMPSHSYTESLLERALGAMQDSSANPSIQIPEAVAGLRAVLIPIFGPGTAERSMQMAAAQTSSRDLSSLTGDDWSEFIANLGQVVASLCGVTAGHLVNRAAATVIEDLQ